MDDFVGSGQMGMVSSIPPPMSNFEMPIYNGIVPINDNVSSGLEPSSSTSPNGMVNAAQNLTFMKMGSPEKKPQLATVPPSLPSTIGDNWGGDFSGKGISRSYSNSSSSSTTNSAQSSAQNTPLTPPSNSPTEKKSPSKLDLETNPNHDEEEKSKAVMLAAFAMKELGSTPPPTPTKGKELNQRPPLPPASSVSTNINIDTNVNLENNLSNPKTPKSSLEMLQTLEKLSPDTGAQHISPPQHSSVLPLRSPKRGNSALNSSNSSSSDDEKFSSGSSNGTTEDEEDCSYDGEEDRKRRRKGTLTIATDIKSGGEDIPRNITPVSQFLTPGMESLGTDNTSKSVAEKKRVVRAGTTTTTVEKFANTN